LQTYRKLQEPQGMDEGLLRRVLVGLSCGRYQECAEAVPEAFGLSRSSVSRRFIQASARKLKTLMERNLSTLDIVALFLDGKSLAEDAMVVAVGVTLEGEKVILGFVQTATENERVIKEFLQSLVARGLRTESGLLCVMDGAKGLRAAVRAVLGDAVEIQRCQWHKRENVGGLFAPWHPRLPLEHVIFGPYAAPRWVGWDPLVPPIPLNPLRCEWQFVHFTPTL